jgi:acetyltransferase-like isoleucine patch superfamily enzyme
MRGVSLGSHLKAAVSPLRQRAIRAILAYRVRARNPTLNADATSIWDYGFHDLDAIELGRDVTVGPFAEILVYHRSPRSVVPGRLIVGDGSHIGFATDVRAAGGTIRIGAGTSIAQQCVLVAANHSIRQGEHFRARWDEERCGIEIGHNVWVGAGSVILPGAVVGDDSVIAAGSVVLGTVPSGELWAGVPAKRIRSIGSEQSKDAFSVTDQS